MSKKKKAKKAKTPKIKTLADFRPAEITAVCKMRFRMGYAVAETAKESGLPRGLVREIENALIHAVGSGETKGLKPAQIKAVKAYLAKKQEPARANAKDLEPRIDTNKREGKKKIAEEPAAKPDLPARQLVADVNIANITALTNVRSGDLKGKAFDELVESIRANGVLEPLILCSARSGGPDGRKYWLVCGYRRFLAAQKAGLDTVPAVVYIKPLTREQRIDIQLEENLRREDLNPADEAAVIRKYIDAHKISVEEMALRIGKSEGFVRGRLKISRLHKSLLKKLRDGKLEVRKALYLAAIEDQKKLAKSLAETHDPDEFLGQSFEAMKRAVEGYALNLLSAAPFNIHQDNLLPHCGSCAFCEKRSDRLEDLFGETIDEKDARCCDLKCWREKHLTTVDAEVDKLVAAFGVALMTEADFKAGVAWHEWDRQAWRYLGVWAKDNAALKAACRDGCPHLRIWGGSLAQVGQGDIIGAHVFCNNDECGKEKPKSEAKPAAEMTPAERKKDDAEKQVAREEQLARRVREWAWEWTREWLGGRVELDGIDGTNPIDRMFFAIILRAAEKWFADWVRESFFPSAQADGFVDDSLPKHEIAQNIIGKLVIGNDLGIDLFALAKFAGIDLHEEFKPSAEFLTLYQTTQLHRLVRQTGWDKFLPENWPKLCKRELIEALLAIAPDDLAKCHVPAELKKLFEEQK